MSYQVKSVWIAAAGHDNCEAMIRIASTISADACMRSLEDAMAEEIKFCEEADAWSYPEPEAAPEVSMWFVGPFLEDTYEVSAEEREELAETGTAFLEC